MPGAVVTVLMLDFVLYGVDGNDGVPWSVLVVTEDVVVCSSDPSVIVVAEVVPEAARVVVAATIFSPQTQTDAIPDVTSQ